MDEITGKIARKYMAHFLDASFGGSVTDYVRLGADLEEYSVDLSPSTDTTVNIIGETSFKHNGNTRSGSVEPYYAVVGDPLFEKLQEFIDEDITDDRLKTTILEVHLWDGDESAGYTAIKQDAYVVPTSYGGDTSGYQIPFELHYVGARTKGKFSPSSKTFS